MMLWSRGDQLHGLCLTTRHISLAVADPTSRIHAEITSSCTVDRLRRARASAFDKHEDAAPAA